MRSYKLPSGHFRKDKEAAIKAATDVARREAEVQQQAFIPMLNNDLGVIETELERAIAQMPSFVLVERIE